LLADLAFGRALGFGAKLCIHPKQVAVIRKALLPTAAEIDWARRVVAAAAAGGGAVQVDGRMVDRPVLLKARAILDRLSE
jgi:citrate lyase subunit beta/citryl-CoA lyase